MKGLIITLALKLHKHVFVLNGLNLPEKEERQEDTGIVKTEEILKTEWVEGLGNGRETRSK